MVVDGTHLKLYVWYDNEYGYSARMVDVALMVGPGPRPCTFRGAGPPGCNRTQHPTLAFSACN